MKKLLREPLFHFMLIGALIFGVNAWRSRGETAKDELPTIEVTAGTLAWLSEGFSKQWNRPPDEKELRGLADDFIREEVLYREALAMGLDRDDTIVRRRMAQKLEFLGQDIASAEMPEEGVLKAFFEKNTERYAAPGRVSFRHIYFSKERRGTRLDDDARAALEALAKGGDETAMGDPFLLEHEFVSADETEISAALGGEIAGTIKVLPVDEWQGPVTSSYGKHLVLVTAREGSRAVAFESVREAVARDFSEEQRITANQDFLRRLKDRYQIHVDEAALQHAATLSTETATR